MFGGVPLCVHVGFGRLPMLLLGILWTILPRFFLILPLVALLPGLPVPRHLVFVAAPPFRVAKRLR